MRMPDFPYIQRISRIEKLKTRLNSQVRIIMTLVRCTYMLIYFWLVRICSRNAETDNNNSRKTANNSNASSAAARQWSYAHNILVCICFPWVYSLVCHRDRATRYTLDSRIAYLYNARNTHLPHLFYIIIYLNLDKCTSKYICVFAQSFCLLNLSSFISATYYILL